MSSSIHPSASPCAFAAPDTLATTRVGEPHADSLQALVTAGRRGAPAAATMQAARLCWRLLACTSVDQRRALHDALRRAIDCGQTTTRAWLPVALGETDPALIGAAVTGYLGTAPRSVEQREQALVDVVEWFRRGLALDGVAVFIALLAARDPEVNDRLALVRGRLSEVERARVLREFAGTTDAATRDFLDDWRGESPGEPPTFISGPDPELSAPSSSSAARRAASP
jgi:hypothetical protein